jgi:hypothetical protein
LAASLHDIEICPPAEKVEGSVEGVDHVAALSWLKISSREEVLGSKPIAAHSLSAKQLSELIV